MKENGNAVKSEHNSRTLSKQIRTEIWFKYMNVLRFRSHTDLDFRGVVCGAESISVPKSMSKAAILCRPRERKCRATSLTCDQCTMTERGRERGREREMVVMRRI